jgi:hypothetical protein
MAMLHSPAAVKPNAVIESPLSDPHALQGKGMKRLDWIRTQGTKSQLGMGVERKTIWPRQEVGPSAQALEGSLNRNESPVSCASASHITYNAVRFSIEGPDS